MTNENFRKFDTNVQHLKYKVLREVARSAWNGTLMQDMLNIPKWIVQGKKATMRCCVYKERAIVSERIKLAIGSVTDSRSVTDIGAASDNVIEVISVACDECPVQGYEVTNSCRGCISHPCHDVCRRGAIFFDKQQRAHIDKDKCVECGMCAKVCPFSAIANFKRPCETACKVDAIKMNADRAASIDNGKCISCGACVYQCPFGAIMDKSYLLDAIDIIKKSGGNAKYKTYAVVAPSVSSQFTYAKLGQVISGIGKLGFFHTVEAAAGADITAWLESAELYEKAPELKYLTSSCCPAFVAYIRKSFPQLAEHISHNLSPMAAISKYIKSTDPTAKIVFIGPCTAKKAEARLESVKPYVDCVLTFEELQALFDSRDIDITALDETPLDNASYYGRVFARSGGVSTGVAQAVREHGYTGFELKAVPCDGIEECKKTLLKLKAGLDIGNFIEGMACYGGCINGAGCLTHGEKNRKDVDKYGAEALEKDIRSVLSAFPGIDK